MKFWKNIANTIDRRKRQSMASSASTATTTSEATATPTPSARRRRSQYSRNDSIYDDFKAQEMGTTFVELIRRPGTYLGVVASDREAKIAQLIPGSWAQRSDVLCVGDRIVSVNGLAAESLSHEQLSRTLEDNDRIQLEVRYRLPPQPSSMGRRRKVIQVTLKKENGSFGMVIRGGHDEDAIRKRPFTVVHVTFQGAAFNDGSVRPGDRILAINGKTLHGTTLPQLQGLIYAQDADTVFTVEYDVMSEGPSRPSGPLLVEIKRDVGDILGFGLNKCMDSGHIFIESVKAASLAERCGALNVGDLLLAVNGKSIARMEVEQVIQLIRSPPEVKVVQLEVLPSLLYHRNRASLPSPMRTRAALTPHQHSFSKRRSCSRFQSLTDIDRPNLGSNAIAVPKERKKFVSFTVDLQSEGQPLGMTLAADTSAELPGPVYISAVSPGGLADRTKAIQVNDQLVEINGHAVQGKCLNEVIPLLQTRDQEQGIKLKLARLISIPERPELYSLANNSRRNSGESIYAKKPPLPSPSPNRYSQGGTQTPKGPPCVSLLASPPNFRSRSTSSSAAAVPTEVHRVTLFKDNVYDDFGFSVSDGLYDKGIYVARVRAGGPADNTVSLLKPMDRILQINETRTHEFDCCLAVPLIAASGEKLELLITRTNGDSDPSDTMDDASTLRSGRASSQGSGSTMPWIDDDTLRAVNSGS